ncbi:hypothetical protein [Clostridium pasteurianum]|uniref:Uncharacterized protein n=1 Tax=Clostridium pasteurianum BC1 TaxID=86416 RepID=R4K4B6_CLOPA|nr:hypothetical protein [Clostridium pasteurianum]AGK95384.1 hypothetical protein Clopa_0322 [Clostridium pasteurianum BC1]
MAQYRFIYTNFWESPKVAETFTPEDKLFFLYLLTNSHTTQIGVYRITPKFIAYELGYSIESVNSLLARFEEHHKIIKYNEKTRELAIRNWGKFNLNKGGKPVEDCINKEFTQVDDKSLLLYVMDSIKSPRIRQLFIAELQRNNLLSTNDNFSDDTVYDTSRGSSTISGQKENKKENENKNKKENKDIYINPSDNVDHSVDNVDINDNSNEDIEGESKAEDTETLSENVNYEDIRNLYNNICKSLPRATTLTKKRKATLKARCKTFKDIKIFQELFSKAEKSDFLSGRNGKWTSCNFDWLINEENMVKVLEDTYINSKNTGHKKTTFNDYEQRENDYSAMEAQALEASDRAAKIAAENLANDPFDERYAKLMGH